MHPVADDKKLSARFYQTPAGNEPVRDWLKDELSKEERKAVGADVATVQRGWPLGMPLIESVATGIWEVRTSHENRITRVVFTLVGSEMVLLHGFIKKTQAMPKSDLDLAKDRRKEVIKDEKQRKTRKQKKPAGR